MRRQFMNRKKLHRIARRHDRIFKRFGWAIKGRSIKGRANRAFLASLAKRKLWR